MPKRRSSPITRQIRVIRSSITALDRALARLLRSVRKADKVTAATPAPRRKLRLTARRKAELKLQGSYIGHLRQLGARQKMRVKDVRAKQGIRQAILLARRLSGKN